MKKELGKWLMDIAKYITTAALLSTLFTNIARWEWYFYVFTIMVVILTLVVGLWLIKEKERK